MSLLKDIRLAWRLLRRSPASTGIALSSIALSVGAAAVIFAAMKSVLIDPLPYTRPGELVQLRSEYPRVQEQAHGDWVVWNDALEVARRTRTLESVGVYGNAIFDLAGDSHTTPEALYGLRVKANVFQVLGVSPMLGRNILPEEDQPGHPDVMVLSYGLWVRRFHSDRSIVGRTVAVNGHGCLVVGVMAPEFNFPLRREAAHTPSPYVEFWAAPLRMPSNPDAGLGAVARLRPGVSLEQARQDIASISRALAHEFPATNRDRILTVNFLRDRTVGIAGKGLLLLMAGALLFMLIGCANVANLLLARGLARQREMAVRLAIGAGRWRIVRQLLTESCVLAALGGLGGYVLTAAAWKILPALAPVSIPRLAAARADAGIFAFALALAGINGILFGIAPALRMAGWRRAMISSGFGSRGAASGRHDRMRSSLVAAEVGLSVLLVVTGGQVLASFVRLVATDPGFQAARVLASVVLPAPERYRSPEQRSLFYQRILDSVRALPGVESAGTVDALPFSGENHGGFVIGSDAADTQPLTAEIDVTGGEYLQAMGIRLAEGRWFRADETSATNDSAIVNTLVARRLWPGARAIGQRICVYCTPQNPHNWKRVIGVVASASHAALDEPEKGNVYLAAGAMETSVFLVVRTQRPAGEMRTAIRRAIAAIDPDQPVFLSASMQDLIADSVADRRFIMMLFAITGCLALMMSAAGVYGVISYTTSRRTQEIGVRMAVGATPGNIFSLIFRQGFLTAAIGLTLGLAAALVATRLLRSVLFGLESGHPAPVWIAAGVVAVTAGIACWIPARKATRTDPMSALRQE
ncbi:MAG TPA: ABC transporter permease [Bryobacteraceae bacterium]|nr:ABC transporter permease [Bryobacteraceae bacterium]